LQGGALLDDGNAAATTPCSEVDLKDSPRGPIKFDHLGNVIGNFYVRHCEKVNGKLVNMTIKTYHNVSQFWTYDEKKFLTQPVCSRDFPPLKS
jgi:branched-chain amino acid transport system substrate-binding protein